MKGAPGTQIGRVATQLMVDRKRLVKRFLVVVGLLIVVSAAVAVGVLSRLLHRKAGEGTAPGQTGIGSTISQIWNTLGDPRSGFPGQNRITILCMGIDDNWTDKDQVYTKDARSDTLFVLTLNLDTHKASILSIPRDTYAHIAGTRMTTKVNAAYQTGGPPRAIATVDELLGVRCDYYMVLNIDATKKMVDALGGVDVDVEHEMHYHDAWGHLSIDLMPGMQHLNGDQAVGFARYRHPDAGKKATPEDGDERRTYRQHVLFKAMSQRAKTIQNMLQVNDLMDVAMSTIQTDLRRDQILDLANIFHGVQPDDILSATLPGDDFRGPNNEWFIKIFPEAAKFYVQWLVFGDEAGARHLTPVIVKNETSTSGLAAIAAAVLRSRGYNNVQVDTGSSRRRGNDPSNMDAGVTTIVDTGVPDSKAGRDIASELGLTSPQISRVPNKPKKGGWTQPGAVTIALGEDYKAVAPATAPEAANSPDFVLPRHSGAHDDPFAGSPASEPSGQTPAQPTGETSQPPQVPAANTNQAVPADPSTGSTVNTVPSAGETSQPSQVIPAPDPNTTR